MQHSNSDQRRQRLAQISQKARQFAQRVDENLTDTLSLMDFNFSFDGFGQLCNDLGRACEVSKLAKIPGKCVDLAKKFADEVSSEWLGLDPDSAVSEETTSQNSESESEEQLDENSESKPQGELNESEERLDEDTQSESDDENDDDSAISGVSLYHLESIGANKPSNQESEIKPPIATEAASLGPLKQNEGYVSLKAIEEHYHRAYMRALMPSSIAELNPNKAYENLSVGLNALSEVSESDDDSSIVVSSDKTDNITSEADNLVSISDIIKFLDENVDENFSDIVLDDTTSEMLSSQVDVLPIETHEDLNVLVESNESHDRKSKVDPIDKTDETTDEADNSVNISKSLEYGEFEDIDLMDDWKDDIDYDLDLFSYYKSKKSSKDTLAAKFISRLRSSKKSQLSKVVDKHIAEANTADFDWEIV